MKHDFPQPTIRPAWSDPIDDDFHDGVDVVDALAPATIVAYRADWHAFTRWCSSHGCQPLPAAPETVVAWLTSQAAAGYANATLQRRSITIARTHRREGHPLPTDHPSVKSTWIRLRRELGVAPHKVAPITLELLRTLIGTRRPAQPATATTPCSSSDSPERCDAPSSPNYDATTSNTPRQDSS